MDQPLVSIIIPAYNCLHLLQESLPTVFSQDIADLGEMEIIVVDDGSSDGTWDYLQSLAPDHPELRLLHLNDLGVAKARNAGLAAARGTYIRFMDGDDMLTPGSMRALLEPLLANTCDFAVGAFLRRVGPTTTLRNAAGASRICSLEEYLEFFTHYCTSYYVGVVWNKLFRRDIIEANHIQFRSGFFYGEDFLFVTEYLAYCTKVSITETPVYIYYFNPKGMTIRQVKSCFTHPIKNLQIRMTLFRGYKQLFRKVGLYEKYRLRVNMYPIQVNLDQ